MSAIIMSGTGGKRTVWFYARGQVGRRRSDRLSERMAFSYRVSLQVRHPDADPEKMIAGIGRAARRYWKAGEERTTPNGTPLPDTYRESYWVFDLGEGEDGQLAVFLRRTLVVLEQVAEFINELRRTGGKVNYYVSWFPGNHGEVFDVNLIADMARLGIDLGIEPVC